MDFVRKPAIPTILVLALLVVNAASRMLFAAELLCGEWDLALRCDSEYFKSDLFPPSVLAVHPKQEDSIRRKKRFTNKSHPCRLIIHPNGTFCLSPKQTSAQTDQNNLLAIRGSWEVKQNPYCVTDRFFDEVILTSYPRVQKEISQGEENIVKHGHFTLHGRLFGHFSAGRISRRLKGNTGWYAKGRISRGMIHWETKEGGNPSRSCVKASFCGQRLIPPTIPISRREDDSDDPY